MLLASLRERIVGRPIGQPLAGVDASIDVAAAQPDRLGVELVNRCHAVKRAGPASDVDAQEAAWRCMPQRRRLRKSPLREMPRRRAAFS